MSGYGYKPYVEGARSRTETPEEKKKREFYEEFDKKYNVEEGFLITEEKLEKERLEQLAEANANIEDISGQSGQYVDPTFDPAMGYSGSGVYNRPPTGWDYDKDMPKIEYYDMFGEPSLEDKKNFEKEFDRITGTMYDGTLVWSDSEIENFATLRNDFLSGKISPHAAKTTLFYYRDDKNIRAAAAEESKNLGIEYGQATSLEEAKVLADNAYMASLEKAKENATGEELEVIEGVLQLGPLAFDNKSHYDIYLSLDDDSAVKKAFDTQALVMRDYLNRAGIELTNPEASFKTGGYTGTDEWRDDILTTPFLNTGTALGAEKYAGKDNFNVGNFGTYELAGYDDAPEPDDFTKAVNVGLAVASVANPTLSPLISGATAIATGGDLGDVAKSVIASNIAPDILENTLGNLGVDADLFGIDSNVFSEGVTQVQTALIEGESVTDALGSAFGGEILEAVTPAIEGVLPDIDVPEAFEKAGDILASTIQPAVDTLEEVFEPVVNVIENTANVIEETAEPITNVAEAVINPVIDTVEKAASTVGEAVKPIVDVAEVAVDKTVDVSVDVINALRASVGLPPFGETVENFDANNDGIVTSADAQQVIKDEQPEPLVEPEVSPVEPEVSPVEPEVKDISLAEKTFNSFGIDGSLFGISDEKFSDAMNKAEKAMLEGRSGQQVIFEELGLDALSKLGSEAGGMFMQAINTLDPIVDAFGNVIKPVVQTVGNVIEPVVKPVVDVVETVAKPVVDVVEPVVQTVGDVGQAVVEVAEPVVTTVGDVVETVAKPVVETVEQTAPIVEDIFIDPIKKGVETVVDIGSDVLSEAEDVFIDPVKEGLEAVVEAVPEVDVALPEINVPSFDLPSMLGIIDKDKKQPTQVENLFDKELFKFDTEIKSTQQMLSPMMNLRRYG